MDDQDCGHVRLPYRYQEVGGGQVLRQIYCPQCNTVQEIQEPDEVAT